MDKLGLEGSDRYFDMYIVHFAQAWKQGTAPLPPFDKEFEVDDTIKFEDTWCTTPPHRTPLRPLPILSGVSSLLLLTRLCCRL